MRHSGDSTAQDALYYLHLSPLTPAERKPLDGKFEYEWSELVAVSRGAFAARMADVQTRMDERKLSASVEGPLVIEGDAQAEAKSRHDVWKMRIPQGEIQDVMHMTQRNVGQLVGPVEERYAPETTAAPSRISSHSPSRTQRSAASEVEPVV